MKKEETNEIVHFLLTALKEVEIHLENCKIYITQQRRVAMNVVDISLSELRTWNERRFC